MTARKLIKLIDLPGVSELEAMVTNSNGVWCTEAEVKQRADQISTALFGITEMDAITAPEGVTDEDWDRHFHDLDDASCTDDDAIRYAATLGFDIADADGDVLACYYDKLSVQIVVVAKALLPAARFTPDGSGQAARASVDAATWGDAIERDARRFRPRS